MKIISIILLTGIPFVLLYSRKKKWNSENLKKTLFIVMLATGIIGFCLSDLNEYRLFFYSFVVTPLFLLSDFFAKKISLKKHNRDLNLWLNYSDDIDGVFAPMKKTSKFKTSDIILSISLLILIIGLAVLGAVLFGKDNLYGQLIK